MATNDEIQAIAKIGQKNGWMDIEIEHAINNLGNDYGDETVIKLMNGREMHCPAFPSECDYVRIVQDGYELAYWTSTEWAEDPEVVMGAIMGCARGG